MILRKRNSGKNFKKTETDFLHVAYSNPIICPWGYRRRLETLKFCHHYQEVMVVCNYLSSIEEQKAIEATIGKFGIFGLEST